MGVEVKSVLDTDYNPSSAPARTKCAFLGISDPYRRAAIFPWGVKAQRGPDGEKVVSARAIKHVDELAAIARGDRCDAKWGTINAAILFMVLRHDVESFRANSEACECFAKHVQAAEDAGVQILAHSVRWGNGSDLGKAFSVGPLPVEPIVECVAHPRQSERRTKKRRTNIQNN